MKKSDLMKLAKYGPYSCHITRSECDLSFEFNKVGEAYRFKNGISYLIKAISIHAYDFDNEGFIRLIRAGYGSDGMLLNISPYFMERSPVNDGVFIRHLPDNMNIFIDTLVCFSVLYIPQQEQRLNVKKVTFSGMVSVNTAVINTSEYNIDTMVERIKI